MPQTAPPSRRVVLLLVLVVVGGLGSFAHQMFRSMRAIHELSKLPVPRPSTIPILPADSEADELDELRPASLTTGPGRHLAMIWVPHDLEPLIARTMTQLGLDPSGTPAERLARLEALGDDPTPEASLTKGLILCYQIPGDSDVASRGARCFAHAAGAGQTRALTELGRIHLRGRGMPMDTTAAAGYLEAARQAGDAEGKFVLAMAHRFALIPTANPRLARPLLVEAAEQGHVGARLVVYWLNQSGEITLFDRDQPLAWIEDSARAGDPTCQLEVATHAFARGDYPRAAEMLTLGVQSGSIVAAERLTQLCLSHPDVCPMPEVLPQFAARLAPDPAHDEARTVLLRSFVELGRDKASTEASAWLAQLAARGDERALLVSNGTDAAAAYAELSTRTDEGIRVRRLELEAEKLEAGSDYPPRPTYMPQPEYPAKFREQKLIGRAVVKFVVDTTGSVRDPELVECTHPAFGDAALAAIQTWRFKPAKKAGKLVNTRVKQSFRFTYTE